MTEQEISDKYNISITLLDKMREDSKTGSLIRKYSQIFDDFYVIEVIYRNGELETKVKGVGNPTIFHEGKEMRYVDFIRLKFTK